jgi:hypothetical protein
MKRLIYLLTILAFISCGETEYQKKLKTEISKIDMELFVDSAEYEWSKTKIDSLFLIDEKSSSDLIMLEALMKSSEELTRKKKDLEQRKTNLELELAKTK